ncbi:MAG TPA: hypothetical protein VNX86_03910 [Rhizomicrobium sp.]|nr:hypothetical protein [Rhizomicrobium sp.]
MNKYSLPTFAIIVVIGIGGALFFKNNLGENLTPVDQEQARPADPEQARLDAFLRTRHNNIHVLSDAEISAEEDRVRAKEDAEDARKQAAKEAAEDAAEAKRRGISLAVFERAKELETNAWAACGEALRNSARYDAKSDWSPNFDWSTNGDSITIMGRDVHLQNGFGAYSAGYSCTWDMKTKAVTALNAGQVNIRRE